MEKLTNIQNELKVPKGNYNSFGKYKYRSCEDILEALKPLLLKYKAKLILSDTVESIGNKLFLKATSSLSIESEVITSFGYAELSEHKGMSAEQCTGTASSYARKYALNGLFLIDETEQDADHDNKVQTQPKEAPKATELPYLNKGTESYYNVVDALTSKKYTVDQVKIKYRLSKDMETELNNINK